MLSFIKRKKDLNALEQVGLVEQTHFNIIVKKNLLNFTSMKIFKKVITIDNQCQNFIIYNRVNYIIHFSILRVILCSFLNFILILKNLLILILFQQKITLTYNTDLRIKKNEITFFFIFPFILQFEGPVCPLHEMKKLLK